MAHADRRRLGRRRPAAHPFLALSPTEMLARITAAIDVATIYEEPVVHPGVWSLGEHNRRTRVVRLNTPLARVLVGIHELTHFCCQELSEEAVEACSHAMRHALTDEKVLALNAAIEKRAATCARRRRRAVAKRAA